MLEVRKLSVVYGAHRALENVSIRVSPGEICVILGANGAGKSSLLKAIGGMVTASGGAQILINGRDITRTKPHKIVEAGLALVPEGRGIFGELTVAENLQLGAYGPQARDHEEKRREQVLALFPRLAERRNQIARTMSGGEQQMVAIGRALMSNPAILMLDEPSLGLSPLLTKDLFKSLKAVRETGVGILLVEQNAKQSLAIADRGYLIENGHITGEGTGAELSRDPAVQAAYLGGAAAAQKTTTEKTMHEEHRRFYVPAGAAGGDNGRAAAQPVAAEQPSRAPTGGIRPEHGRFYVPAAAGGGAARVNGSASAPAGGSTARPEARGFYVPSGASGGTSNGSASYSVNGHAGHATTAGSRAEDLSRQATEFVKRAVHIHRQHVEAQRVDHHISTAAQLVAPEPSARASDADNRTEDMVARATRIQREFIEARRAAAPISGHDAAKLKGRSKKLAKKAEKLARKAEKLAEKAMRAND